MSCFAFTVLLQIYIPRGLPALLIMKALIFSLSLLCCVSVGVSLNRSCLKDHHCSTYPGRPILLDNIKSNESSSQQLSISCNDSTSGLGFKKTGTDSVALMVYDEPQKYIKVTVKNSTCKENSTRGLNFYVKLLPCPPGFMLENATKSCTCLPPTFLRAVHCLQTDYVANVFVGYCVSRNDSVSDLLITRCPFTNHITSIVVPLTQNESTGEARFCSKLHRHGELCGKCNKDRGVSVFSDTFKCIKCDKRRLENIALYLVVEFLPTTIFIMVILYFHIGITTGPANGFIFFSQMMTTPIQVLYLQYGLKIFFKSNAQAKYLSGIMADVVIDPYCIWNLDFFRIFHPDICFSTGLGVIDILALRYISAVYPLLLLLLAYIFIELQAMNVRPVVWLWKILCFPCVRWRRVWKAKTSVVDAFATGILLSYTKLMYVSFLLLSSSKVFSNGGGCIKHVLNFDPTIEYLKGKHVPYAVLSVAVILTFGIGPPVLLTFYQCGPCRSCLERLRLRRPGLEQFVEAFQGCYKDGTNEKVDRRFFAGLYFVFRVIILLTISQSQDVIESQVFVAAASITFLLVCAVSQPYKKTIYTVIDCVLFALLALITLLQLYIYITLTHGLKLDRTFLLYYFALYVPLLYIVCYVARWLFLCYRNRDSHRYVIPDHNDELREPMIDARDQYNVPAFIDTSPRPSITHTEVSINELPQEREGHFLESESTSDGEREASPLIKKKELDVFSYGATSS